MTVMPEAMLPSNADSQHVTTVLPLVVDLDDSLVQTDTLLETLVGVAFKAPRDLASIFGALLQNRAAFKRAATTAITLDPAALPYNQDVLDLIQQRRVAGGAVHLITAADQRLADGIAAHLGLFDSVMGSDGYVNNKGATKAELLRARFPNGFAYIGDCVADIPVWKTAAEVIVVQPSNTLRRSLDREDVAVDRVLVRPMPTLRTWARALRLHQWSKNALIFMPLLLSQQFGNIAMTSRSVAMFLLFGVIASSTYVLNDLGDLTADRLHPSKRRRPLAAGVLPIRIALPVATLMLIGGLAGTLCLGLKSAGVAISYVIITLLYTFALKAQVIVDTITIGGLFCVRVVAGMAVLNQPISIWLCTLTLVLFTSLALAKRNGEMVRAASAGRHIAGRGYSAGDVLLTTSVGIACGITAVLVTVLYMALEAMNLGLYANQPPLFLIPLVLLLWVMRIWVLAHRGILHDDPVSFALKDRVSWGYGAAVVIFWLAAIYT
jgi:4-hydroxybenzoate polyprenyltransferase/phosphoserine phosphatase